MISNIVLVVVWLTAAVFFQRASRSRSSCALLCIILKKNYLEYEIHTTALRRGIEEHISRFMIRMQCCMQNIYSYSNTQIRVRIYMGLEVAVLMPLIYLHQFHYSDVIMGTMASQTTSLTIVYTTIYSGADQRKHQSSAPLAFVRGIHRIHRTNGQ